MFTLMYSQKIYRGLLLALTLLTFAFSGGCAAFGGGAVEKTSRDWYDEGVQLSSKKRYPGAVEALKEAATLYRDATLDADIHIALGDAYFHDRMWEEAIDTYREFLRIHPRDNRNDYAQFQIGMCYFSQMRTMDRSQEPTVFALEAFTRVVSNYPRSELLREAREKIDACRRQLAEHEIYVGKYYLRTKACSAAVPRFDKVYKEFGDLGFGDDALFYLGLCYFELEEGEKAREAWDLLIRDYPNSSYRKEITDREE